MRRGETGISIARAYGVPWSRIADANRIGRDSLLEIGQPLFIPLAAAPARPAARSAPDAPLTPEERAAAFSIDVDDLITGSAEARPRGSARSAPEAPTAPARIAPSAAEPSRAVAPPADIPPLAWPVDGRVILSGFGPKAGGRVNDGIAIKTLRGATVRSAADGQVIYVGDAVAGYGLMILVRHGAAGPDAVITAYGHLEDALVDRGARVVRGQPIARAGSTGAATEPQLLFQLRQGRRPLNPSSYLPR